MGECGEFVRGITELGNGRAGSECVRFRQGTGTGLRDDRLIGSRIHGDTGLGGAAFGDPRVGQGDPGVKPGAFLPGPPLFLRSRRGDHGPNGYGLNGYVWVLGPELPGLTGGRIALGSKANGQGGDGVPPRGRRPTVVDGRTWVLGADGCGERMDVEMWRIRLQAQGCWRRIPWPRYGPRRFRPRIVTRGKTGCGAAARSPTRPLVSRGTASLLPCGGVGFRRALRRRGCWGCCNAERLSRNGRLLAPEEWPAFRADGRCVRARPSFTVKCPGNRRCRSVTTRRGVPMPTGCHEAGLADVMKRG